MSWKIHMSLRPVTEMPQSKGDIEAACGKVIPNVEAHFTEAENVRTPCLKCLEICSQDMPKAGRKYFTYLIPIKPAAEDVA